MITKKTLLIVSGAGTVLLLVLNWVGTFKLCGGQEYGQCMDTTYGIMINLLPILPLFLLSLITYKMRDEVYRAWLHFAYIWIPLSILAILLAPEYSSDWMFPIVKGTVAFFSSLIFVAVSLVIIAYKYTVSRHRL
jgi:hypothetical protein